MLSDQIDHHLLDLAWSLWNELGVAGIHRKHLQTMIMPEELILLTAILSKTDPRLRDEALDWCSRNHELISVSRLKTLAHALGDEVMGSFSEFAATLNTVSTAKWPVLTPVSPLKLIPSKKSKPPSCDRPALLLFRLRELFGVGARADLIAFFLAQEKTVDFAIADCIELGYTKRALANVLDAFVEAGLVETTMVRNQQRYHFAKRDLFQKLIGPLPERMPPWRTILEAILPLRACVLRIEKKPDGVKVIEVSNLLQKLEAPLQQLRWHPPKMQSDLGKYWLAFEKWIIEIVKNLG